MTEFRVRGQEVTIRLSRNANVEATLTAIKSFSLQMETALLDEGYLGETSKRKDDIFNGFSGNLEFDIESPDLFIFMKFIQERAQRKLPVNETRINAAARFAFPSGDLVRVVLPDLKFGAVPVNSSGRDAYVTSSFAYACSDARFLTT